MRLYIILYITYNIIYIVQEAGIKTIPKKKKCKNAKWLSEEGLTNSCEKKKIERQRRKGKLCPFECRVPKNKKER